MKYVAVLPSIYPPWTEECRKNLRLKHMLIDNTVHNRGSVSSWNLGIDQMRQDNADWLIVISAAMRFGPNGGLDFLDALREHEGFIAIEAEKVYGWHFIAFSRDCIENVGKFDANFYPYGFDDIDYSLRIQKHYYPGWPDAPRPNGSNWTKVNGDWTDAGMAHGVKLAGVKCSADPLLAYYREKWGGDKGLETFDRPFGDSANSLAYWPETRGERWDA